MLEETCIWICKVVGRLAAFSDPGRCGAVTAPDACNGPDAGKRVLYKDGVPRGNAVLFATAGIVVARPVAPAS